MPTAPAVAALLAVSAGFLSAPANQQTHPRVSPHAGGRHTMFALSFTLRSAAGHVGVVATDYRIDVRPVRRRPPSCTPVPPGPVQSGSQGRVQRIALGPPTGGWCRGAYKVTVFLERGPYCPPPPVYGRPFPCPEFATQELETGSARFTVR
ncbi:MAG: hypothetical protein ACYDHH_06775 [Solirubrobacteraceae bacterium]